MKKLYYVPKQVAILVQFTIKVSKNFSLADETKKLNVCGDETITNLVKEELSKYVNNLYANLHFLCVLKYAKINLIRGDLSG